MVNYFLIHSKPQFQQVVEFLSAFSIERTVTTNQNLKE